MLFSQSRSTCNVKTHYVAVASSIGLRTLVCTGSTQLIVAVLLILSCSPRLHTVQGMNVDSHPLFRYAFWTTALLHLFEIPAWENVRSTHPYALSCKISRSNAHNAINLVRHIQATNNLVNELPKCYATRNIVIIFARTSSYSPFLDRLIHCTPCYRISLKFILILSSLLILGLPSVSLGFPTKIHDNLWV